VHAPVQDELTTLVERLELVSRKIHHDALGELFSAMFRSSDVGPTGRDKRKIAPCGAFAVARSLAPWASMIERIDNPNAHPAEFGG
jgi:hypothetical protein